MWAVHWVIGSNEEPGQLLLKATGEGDAAAVRTLLEKGGLDVDAREDEYGESSLHIASSEGHFQIVQLLLGYYANPNARDKYQETPLHKAAAKGHWQVVERLLRTNADPNAADNEGWTPLHCASSEGHVQVVDLLKATADPNVQDQEGSTALHLASSRGHVPVVRSLLDAQAATDLATMDYGEIPLHLAASEGQLDVVNLLLMSTANPSAANETGNTTLHIACETHQIEIVHSLLMSGADCDAENNRGYKPLHACLQTRRAGSTREILLLLRLLVSFGARWDARCDDLVASDPSHDDDLVFRLCTQRWAEEHAGQLPFTHIPDDVVERGAASTEAFLASQNIVLQHKIFLVGSNRAGKTRLIKSIMGAQPQNRHDDDRTIDIDRFPFQFRDSENGNQFYRVTFWDFVGKDTYQVASSLFFSPRTLFLVFLDLEAFAIAYMQAAIFANLEFQESDLLGEFIDDTVVRWIRMILMHQPAAQFAIIATKEDLLGDNKDTKELLKGILKDKLAEVGATAQEMRQQFSMDGHNISASDSNMRGSVETIFVEFTSCTTPASIRAARAAIHNLITMSDRSLHMPDTYSVALESIVEDREAVNMRDAASRINAAFVAEDSFPARLMMEREPCRTFLRTLHDIGDVLWYEGLGIVFFHESVILDPLLLVDFIREIFTCKQTDVTLSHAKLKSLPFWIYLSNQKMKAMKQVLQKFNVVYATGGDGVMEWDSALIVAAFWQIKTPASWLFLGDILRLNSTRTRDGKIDWKHHFGRVNTARSHEAEVERVHWEFHFETGLPPWLFDPVVVACMSPSYKFDAGPDWILYEEKGVAACRIMVDRDLKSLQRTIRIEAVVAKTAGKEQVDRLWEHFKLVCGAFVRVLRRVRRKHPRLAVSGFAWDDANNEVGLRELVREPILENSVKWMPPAMTWKWLQKELAQFYDETR